MVENLREVLKDLPELPGVYLMHDSVGEIIYVGKAKVLKNRVKSYFTRQESLHPKVSAMVSHIADIKWIVTGSENEAFALEANLIKKHKPRYNILLRDDKHYPYLRLNMKEDYPRIDIVRRVKNDGARYFGPYFSGREMHAMLDALHKIFPLRTCRKDILRIKGKERPCLNYSIGKCYAPCRAEAQKDAYKQIAKNAFDFLEGRSDVLVEKITESMNRAAGDMEYEKAAMFRDQLSAVKNVMMQRQRAIYGKLENWDVIGAARDELHAVTQLITVRNGRITGSESFYMNLPEGGEEPEIVEAFIKQYYLSANYIPRIILASASPEDLSAIEDYLAEQRGGPVHITVPERGEKKQIVDMAIENAHIALEKQKKDDIRQWERTGGAVDALKSILKLQFRPERIESYDISNIQGVESVASMVVFEGGKSARNQYRRFKIRTVEGANDFASMNEVITRRFARGLAEKEMPDQAQGRFSRFPDLVLIDGGKGQLAAARAAMEELGVGHIQTIGLAKREEEVFFPGESLPVLIPKDSPALHLLQRVRDEAHRFAITYHRSLRNKRGLQSEIENIEGIGPARRRNLLNAFPTISAIKNATLDELAAVDGMTITAARAVYQYYHGSGNQDDNNI